MGKREKDYLNTLNSRQQEAVRQYGSPLLILAGAGSGKTRVITTKIAYLIDNMDVDPYSILAVAFTNKAADEMRTRVRSLAPSAEGVMIKTFHAFGAWLLRRHTHLLGLADHFSIYDDDDSLVLLKNLFKQKQDLSQLKDIRNRISRAKDRCLAPEDDLDSLGFGIECEGLDFSEIYSRYQHKLRESGNADFGDLIMQSVRLLHDNREVRQRICQRFKIILVDEYQDSNLAQSELLSELYNGQNYICVVGDEDQSIYGFRGAEVSNILNFPEKYPDTTIIRLEENYRSTQNILEVASRVVENNTNRLGKTLWTQKPAGSPIVLALLEDQDAEARFCAELLSDRRYADTAILYRMNFQSRVFEALFTNLGIPFRVVGTVRFYEREEVKDALAYLSVLLNPRDEIAFRRALTKPRRGIGEKTLQKILAQRQKSGGDLLESLKLYTELNAGRSCSSMKKFLGLMDFVKRSIENSNESSNLSDLVKYLIRESGLYDHYKERDELEHTERIRNLEELVNATIDYSSGMEALSSFLEGVGLGVSGNKVENPFQAANKVTLITVHNTKGCEFNRVIITGMENGIFPHYSSTVQNLPVAGDDLEEERRLFYVGVTRARESLYLTACHSRRVFGNFQQTEPSKFLGEIPEDFLQVYGQKQDNDGYHKGCRVYLDEYGCGTIIKRWFREGEPVVIVRFDSGKTSRFPLNYTNLERIDWQ